MGQVEALAGTVGTPSSTNEYVTNDDTATTGASVVIRSKANSKIDDSLVGATTAGDTVYSDGTDLQRLAIGSAGQQLVAGPLNAPLYRSSIINLNTTPVTLTNTTVETTLASATLPGNTLGTGGVLRYRLFISDFDDGANDLIFRVKIGATTLITATAGMSGTSDDRNGFIDIFIYANGSASSQYATFSLFASTSGGGTSDFFHLAAAGTATEDTTTNKLISVTGDYTGIGGTDSITISSSVLFYN